MKIAGLDGEQAKYADERQAVTDLELHCMEANACTWVKDPTGRAPDITRETAAEMVPHPDYAATRMALDVLEVIAELRDLAAVVEAAEAWSGKPCQCASDEAFEHDDWVCPNVAAEDALLLAISALRARRGR